MHTTPLRFFHYILVLLLLWTGQSCRRANLPLTEGEKVETTYAQGFQITRYPDYCIADLRDPWDTTRLLHRYIFLEKGKEIPPHLPKGTLIRTPVNRMVVYSAVHGSILNELGLVHSIMGICETEYISVPAIQEGLQSGEIADLGLSFAPDIEKIIELSPEAILVFPFENSGYGRVEKLAIPLVECADYMENTPLGRAEWIRFIGLFTGREREADSIFQEVESRYIDLCHQVTTQSRPSVLSEKKTGATWFVPGGKSYMARLFADAGADYFLKEDSHAGSLAYSFEEVFDRFQTADFWLIKCSAPNGMSRSDLAMEYAPYSRFKAFSEGNIFICNLSDNRFFEEVPFHPELLLKDFILIFHPELFPGEEYRYHFRLQP